MSNVKLKILEKYLKYKSSQEIKDHFIQRPLIHFSNNAEKIMNEGFLYGAELSRIDSSFSDKSSINILRIKDKKGFNFAFDTLNYSFENNCYDYEYGIEGGLGMHEETAILFLSDALYTKHTEGFYQCIFYGEDANLSNPILLKNEGSAYDEDGELSYDENGNEYDCWSATLKDGTKLLSDNDSFSLQESIAYSIKFMIENNLYPQKYIDDFNSLYDETVGSISKKDPFEHKLTRIDALRIVHSVRNELNDEYNLNFCFVDYCDLCSERIIDKLFDLGFQGNLIKGFYHHQYESSEPDNYGHFWVECDNFILDASRDQFDNNDYVINKSEENHKIYLHDQIPIKNKIHKKQKI